MTWKMLWQQWWVHNPNILLIELLLLFPIERASFEDLVDDLWTTNFLKLSRMHRVVQLEEISWQTEKEEKSHLCLVSGHSHTYTRTCAWVPVKILMYYWLACWVMSYWKKLALCTLYNRLRSKLQLLYQLIKCISLKGACHERDSDCINSRISVVIKTHH